jgi:hypothetical protein
VHADAAEMTVAPRLSSQVNDAPGSPVHDQPIVGSNDGDGGAEPIIGAAGADRSSVKLRVTAELVCEPLVVRTLNV